MVPFGEYTPDQPDFQNPGSANILNVLPRTAGSYGPAPALSAVTGALTARCQGATYVRDKAGNVYGFAGDATKLYKMVSGSTAWSDVSRLDTAKVITAITRANPGKVTAVGHGYSNGDTVYIAAVVGMIQVNGLRFTIAVVDADNFTIGVDTSAYTAYGSGGTAQKVLYYTTAIDERWAYAVNGERLLLTNFADPIQSFVMGSSTAFANLSADAPKARYVASVRDFIMVANTSDAIDGAVPQRVWWPAIDDPTNWPTPGSADAAQVESDYNDLAGDGGWNQGIVGSLSAADVAVIQERRIWRGMYVGPPVIFSFSIVEGARGTPAPGSIVSVGPVFYYLADNGFYVCNGAQSEPIGQGKVDKSFWSEVDTSYLYRISGAADPVNKLIYWAYPGPQNSAGLPNRILVFNYELGRWAKIDMQSVEIMANALTTGYTLDQLDSFGTLETLPFSLDSRAWTGGRLNLAAFDSSHKLGLFSGAALAATLETSETQLNAKGSAHISRIWPMVDTASATVTVGRRDRLADPVSWGTATAMTATTGSAPVRSTGRYHRARVAIPASTYWNHAQGVDFDARAAGAR